MEKTQAGIALNSSTLRNAAFPQAFRGYDRRAVHEFLDRIADWVEQNVQAGGAEHEALTSEFAKVGERTSGILTAAEEAAVNLRADAREYAERVRAQAEEDARATRLNATLKADELVAAAEEKAERIIEEAVVRRRSLNLAVGSLVERRDAIVAEARRLADELQTAVEDVQAVAPDELEGTELVATELESAEPEPMELEPVEAEPADAEQAEIEAAEDEPAEVEPPDERDTAVHETRSP